MKRAKKKVKATPKTKSKVAAAIFSVSQWISKNAPHLAITDRGIEMKGHNSLAFPVPALDDPKAEAKLMEIVARLQ